VTAVIDASALLALLFAEPGAETVADAIAGDAAMSAVDLSEVATVLLRHEQDPDQILAPVREQLAVESFTDADALTAATLYPKTAGQGLSLGDRSCLALAQRLDATAMTAEHAWAELKLDTKVQLVRPRSS